MGRVSLLLLQMVHPLLMLRQDAKQTIWMVRIYVLHKFVRFLANLFDSCTLKRC